MSTLDTPGVGPHALPWPQDDRLDPGLLENGDTRNVEDRFRYWQNQAIVAQLDSEGVQLEIAIENIEHDFNMGSIVRTANAFGVRHVHIIGRRQWNKRGAMVTNRYLHVVHHKTAAEFRTYVKDNHRTLVALDNVKGSQPLHTAQLPQRAVILFGQEGPGISSELLTAAEMTVAIEQYGSTRSINVGAAAAIVMYVWLQQHTLAK